MKHAFVTGYLRRFTCVQSSEESRKAILKVANDLAVLWRNFIFVTNCTCLHKYRLTSSTLFLGTLQEQGQTSVDILAYKCIILRFLCCNRLMLALLTQSEWQHCLEEVEVRKMKLLGRRFVF